jgi:threonine dehydratase
MYLEKILKAKVYDVCIETPLEASRRLSERLHNRVLLKREDMQPVFSFKLRGAYNKMVQLSPEERDKGVVASSAGNHAQGVALSAKKLKCRAVIVMPITTPYIKIEAVEALGGIVELVGDTYDEAQKHALALAEEQDLTFVHPYDDPDVIAGQGTIGIEILRQCQDPIDAIFVPIGGGGLISGIASYVKHLYPEIKIIGVEPLDSASMSASLKAGHPVKLDSVGIFADGVAVKKVGQETFRICQELVDEIILVNTDEICAAIKDIFEDTRSIMEPAGALSVAGLKRWCAREKATGNTLVAMACGANMNFDRLRFVTERAELGEHREAVFGVTLPEEKGAFKAFCAKVGMRNITEFNYRFSDAREAHVFVGIQTKDREEAETSLRDLNAMGYSSIDLTDNEVAKLHLRHMVGGRAPEIEHELLFRFIFPERPGALMSFLNSLSGDWLITLFHYRNHGSDSGRVLVGVEVPPDEQAAFMRSINSLGYTYWDETDNPAYAMFLS